MRALSGTLGPLVAALTVAALLSGCGGGSETADTSSSEPTAGAAMPGEEGASREAGASTSAGDEDSIRGHGAEAPGKERAQAARTARAYLAALAAHQWLRACSRLSTATRETLERFAAQARKHEGSGPTGCAQIVRTIGTETPPSSRREAAEIRVRGMRVEGAKAYLIYEDGKGTPSEIAMDREGREWLVADVLGAPLPMGPGSS